MPSSRKHVDDDRKRTMPARPLVIGFAIRLHHSTSRVDYLLHQTPQAFKLEETT